MSARSPVACSRTPATACMEAADGPAAIATWRAFDGRIDLLLTDMVMPGGLSGSDVAERFSADRPDSKILFSSGYSTDLFGSRRRACGRGSTTSPNPISPSISLRPWPAPSVARRPRKRPVA